MKQRVLATAIVVAVAFAALVPATLVAPVAAASQAAAQDPDESKIVEQILFEGNRRIPDDSMRLWVQTREGDPFSLEQVQRDVRTILAQGYFDDVKVYSEEGPRGGLVVTFFVKEYPVILQIDYPGLDSISESDVLDEWRKRSISLSKESQFDPVKATRAARTIEQMLAAKGRPDATVTPEVENISPTAVALHFRTDEGERVRIAEIDFVDNQVFEDGELRGAMKLTKEAGFISGLQSKDTYDKERLAYDLEQVRLYYYDHGYLDVRFGEPVVEEVGRVDSGIPFVGGKDRGLKVTVSVEEGKIYKVGDITIEGETVYSEDIIRQVIGLQPGEVVEYGKIRKGVYEDLKKLYGERGYINFEPVFVPELRDDPNDPNYGIADFNFTLDEGKSFVVRRIEFKGNTFTRDKVLRREVLVNEGDPYNQRLFDLSVLRLNQLGYFNEIKDTDADIRTNQKDGTVDVDLRVQEKGRQQIQFSGGASGVGGSFIGLQYSTNNLFGYGESFSIDVQAGNRSKQFVIGFTEPYLLDRPISAGVQLFYLNYQYFGGGIRPDGGAFTPQSTDGFFNFFGGSGEELFTQRTIGGSVSVSSPLSYFFRRSTAARFSRIGLSYTYRNNEIEDPFINRDDDPANDIFVTYRQPSINQSTLTPTLSYNSLNGALDPTRGQSLIFATSFSGGFLGGDVSTIQPTLEYKFFRPVGFINNDPEKPDVFGFRLLAGHIRAFGTRLDTNSLSFIGGTPVYSRYFLGGEDTIRGFDVRSISPVARLERFVTTRDVTALNVATGEELQVRKPRNSNRRTVAPSVIDTYTLDFEKLTATDLYTPIGADTQLLANFEYRVPIAGPVSVAGFLDIGSAFNINSLDDQLAQSEFVPSTLTPFGVTLNPRGQLATLDEIRDAQTPETPAGQLPPGFRAAVLQGFRQDTTIYRLSEDDSSLASSYRYSLGAEVRVQVPVVNVPFRLIFAYNPNAKTEIRPGQVYLEEKTTFLFSIGRTF